MTRFADLDPETSPVGRCIILPGRRYTPDGPLLFFAAQVALAHAWSVRQVWWDPPQSASAEEEVTWVGDQLTAAAADHDGPVLVVAKSLGTLAARAAAEARYDAAWLTPLLTEPDLVAPLASYEARQLITIGSEDPCFDRHVLDGLPGEHLVVAGDHVLRVPGDPAAMVASHDRFVRAFDTWLSTASPGSVGTA